jgi:hypothetical protein
MTRPRTNSVTIACALLLATATHAHQLAPTTDGRAPRGASGSIEITSVGVPIRAKPASDTTAPILVRVTPLTSDRYRIEYLGLVSGHYDLAPYIEQVDGRAATTLGTIEVDVFTQLPPNAPTDVFGLDAPTFGISAYYRMILASVVAAWLVIPIVILIRRALRAKPVVMVTIEPKAPTTADLLFNAVDAARARELSIDERGRLELLLLQVLRADNPHADLALVMTELRTDARTMSVVRAVERWLHAASEGERATALNAIDALRSTRPATSSVSSAS